MGTIRKTDIKLVKDIMFSVVSGVAHNSGQNYSTESYSAEDVRGYWFDNKDAKSTKLIQHDDNSFTIRVNSIKFLTFTTKPR